MKAKLSKYIVVSLILSGICMLSGALLFNESGKMKTVSVNYNENAKLNYKVYLNKNNYYNSDYLDEGMQYISSIINNIEVVYNYDITYDEKVSGKIDTKVDANIKIVDETNNSKVIYEKSEELKNDKKEQTNVNALTATQTLNIDFQKYNSFATEFKSKYAIPADAKLIVTFTTTQICNNYFIDNINRSKTMSIEIPLSEQMITINKSQDFNEKSAYITTTDKSVTNKVLFVLSIVLFAATVILIGLAIFLKIKKGKLMSEFDKQVAKILKQYDSYITESTGIVELSENVIYVMSFKELLDVRNNVEKAIIYNRPNDKEARFIILDENQEYCYSIRNEEF